MTTHTLYGTSAADVVVAVAVVVATLARWQRSLNRPENEESWVWVPSYNSSLLGDIDGVGLAARSGARTRNR